MPVFQFEASQNNPQTGQVQVFQPRDVLRWTVSAPNKDAAKALSRQYGFGARERQERGIFYGLYTIPWNVDVARLLCVEFFIGAANLDPVAIRGAQPQGQPVARGGHVLDGQRGSDGFMEHGTEALDYDVDTMYGPAGNERGNDLIRGGGGLMEIPRG